MMIKATVIGPEPFAYKGRYRPEADSGQTDGEIVASGFYPGS